VTKLLLLYRSDRPQQFHLIEPERRTTLCGLPVVAKAWSYDELTPVEQAALHRNSPKVRCLHCFRTARGIAALTSWSA
jgi:hypothetical protein